MAPFGHLYGRVIDVRNALYDRGVLRSYPLGARTISIGNLTAGGTGKTPLVALTARILANGGERVCVLTRGYGRANEKERVLVSDSEKVLVDAAKGGDEPVELARALLGKAIVLADADRVAAAEWARERFNISAFVLDDAFQHRRARRDLDIVCVDAMNPFGNDRVLPAGTLRESVKGIRRADAVVVTRANLVDSKENLVHRLRERTQAAIFVAAMRIRSITKLEDFNFGQSTADENENERPATFPLVFSGLGNPESFRRLLESENFAIAGYRAFGDHHRYDQQDVERLEKEAETLSAGSLFTTAKDAVKLTGIRFNLPVYVVEAEVSLNDEAEFRRLILARR